MPLRSFADGAFFGRSHGSGPPEVVALHGWGRTGEDFAPILQGFDAIAVDLPGFGASPPPAEVTGAAGYARLVAPVLDGCAPRVVLVGHSFGGRVGLHMALEHPERVDRLVLTGVPLVRRSSARRPPLGYRIVRGLHRRGWVSEERMEALRRRRGSGDYRAAEGIMRDVLVTVVNESYEDELRAVTVPVHLIWGAGDTEVPVSVAHRAVEILEGAGAAASLDVAEGVGHHLPTERPDLLRRVIEDALA